MGLSAVSLLFCDSQTIIELKVFGLCEGDTLGSAPVSNESRSRRRRGREGRGGGLMISCFSSGPLPELALVRLLTTLVVICIITHPCENCCQLCANEYFWGRLLPTPRIRKLSTVCLSNSEFLSPDLNLILAVSRVKYWCWLCSDTM